MVIVSKIQKLAREVFILVRLTIRRTSSGFWRRRMVVETILGRHAKEIDTQSLSVRMVGDDQRVRLSVPHSRSPCRIGKAISRVSHGDEGHLREDGGINQGDVKGSAAEERPSRHG